jgi:S-formylglutathione hydrolase FrmB
MRILIVGLLFLLALSAHSKDTLLVLNNGHMNVPVRIIYPSKPKATLLLLHGWNLPAMEWCEKTKLCNLAGEKGFILVIPFFAKTTYHFETYPQTRKDYLIYPTRKWMYDVFLVHMQKQFGLLKKGDENFVAGLSTGGRGAALFALENPDIFRGVACLSADFDQRKIAGEPINTGFYGSYNSFPERWSGRDNIYLRASAFQVPVYLAHGKKDALCPFTQTQSFADTLKKLHPTLEIRSIIDPEAQHNYRFWSKHSNALLLFFESLLK